MSFVLHEQLSASSGFIFPPPSPLSLLFGIPDKEAQLFKYLAVSLAFAAAS